MSNDRAEFDPFNPRHRAALLGELAVYAPQAPAGAGGTQQLPNAPATNAGAASVAADLSALARCVPALLGGAMPLLRIPGGQSAGSPAEHVQPHLSGARRALRRLAWLRDHDGYGHALTLLFAYVHLGEEHRAGDGWYARVRAVLLPDALAPKRPGDLAAARALGERMVRAAEAAYLAADEIESDGRWLAIDLDAIADRVAGRSKAIAPVRAVPVCRPLGWRVAGWTESGCVAASQGADCAWPAYARCATELESQTWRLLKEAAA